MSTLNLQDWTIDEDRANDKLILRNKANSQEFVFDKDGSNNVGNSTEEVEDIVGAMVGHGLEYDDGNNVLSKTRQGPNPYDAAQTFTESDVTLSHDSTNAESGAIELNKGYGTVASWPEDGSFGESNSGIRIELYVDCDGLKFTSGGANVLGSDEIRIYNYDTDTLVASKNVNGIESNTDYLVEGKFYANTTYQCVQWGDSGGEYAGSSPNLPYTSNDVDIINGASGRSGDSTYDSPFTFSEVAPYHSPSSGSVTVEWPNPNDIYEWDVATFTRTLDNETVDVYVAYSTDGGSTWSRTNGGNPISRNYSLSDDSNISPSDDVRIEAELSRSDTSNNPTLDSAYRSWFV